MQNKDKAIDLLRKANKKTIISEEFRIPLEDEQYIFAVLTAPDMMTLQRAQKRTYTIEIAKMKAEDSEGFYLPIDEDKWNESLEPHKDDKETLKRLEESKPKFLGEQIVNEEAMTIAIQNLLPAYLKDKKGEPLFKTKSEQKEFTAIMCGNLELFKLLSEKYVSLITQMSNAAKEANEVKND